MAHYIDGKEYAEVSLLPVEGDYVYVSRINHDPADAIRKIVSTEYFKGEADQYRMDEAINEERVLDADSGDVFAALKPAAQPVSAGSLHVDLTVDDEVIDKIAILATEVSKLRLDVDELKEREDSNSKDIRRVTQEVDVLNYGVDELYGRLGHVEADAEMLIDDVAFLDERGRGLK